MNKLNDLILRDFVEEIEMTILSSEDSILLDGMVGTSSAGGNNCMCNGNNCPCGGNNCSCKF